MVHFLDFTLNNVWKVSPDLF